LERRETKRSRRDKEREVKEGRRVEGGGRSKRKRSSAMSNKSSRDAVQSEQIERERGPKGKKTRRSALRGDAEGNEGVHKEEARMDEGRREVAGM